MHLYKHLQNAGYGVQALADLYLFRKENPDLDWNYIGVEMRKLGLTEEERAIHSLPLKIFDQEKEPDLSQKERECMHLILSSGAYGNFDNKIRNALNKIRYERRTTSRFRLQMLYILERLYPTGPQYKDFYPVFYRHRLLFPLLPIYRFIRTFVKRKKGGLVKEELVSLLKVKKEDTGSKPDRKQE